jgi:hypothetical protein
MLRPNELMPHPEMMQTDLDNRWAWDGVTSEFLETKAEWLRESRQLHHTSVNFFALAAKLILYSRYDYPLASLAFFQAIIGLERAFKIHYNSEKEHFSTMFKKAVDDGLITDALFLSPKPLPKEWLKQLEKRPSTHAEALSLLIPKLRNQFVHGTYLISPEYLFLTFQLREIADALTTNNDVRAWSMK